MVGRKVERVSERRAPPPGEECIRLDGFSVYPAGFTCPPAARDVSLNVRAGEIVGVAGLQGSGASELLWGLFGAYGARTRGSVVLRGDRTRMASPAQAIGRGVALLTNDRKATGLVLNASVTRNAVLAQLPRFSPGGWCRPRRERNQTRSVTEALKVRSRGIDVPVSTLSGGNQQKVALARWILAQPRLLLLDEPTRGIDVGAKREIYALMNEWTARGIGIMLITSEMPELLAMSDRIVVLHRGEYTAEFAASEATAAAVLEAAMGKRIDRSIA
jgi:ABC-type sugar transport system ATPase subunit